MAFFDYNHDGKKDWKDNTREYYLYNKMQVYCRYLVPMWSTQCQLKKK